MCGMDPGTDAERERNGAGKRADRERPAFLKKMMGVRTLRKTPACDLPDVRAALDAGDAETARKLLEAWIRDPGKEYPEPSAHRAGPGGR